MHMEKTLVKKGPKGTSIVTISDYESIGSCLNSGLGNGCAAIPGVHPFHWSINGYIPGETSGRLTVVTLMLH